MPYLERALVDIVNMVGVDINRAGRSPYYCSLLTYVAGLGPRKALSVMKKINTSLVRSVSILPSFPNLTCIMRDCRTALSPPVSS